MSGSILIAVDGSEHATKAIAIAADLAAAHDAELVLWPRTDRGRSVGSSPIDPHRSAT